MNPSAGHLLSVPAVVDVFLRIPALLSSAQLTMMGTALAEETAPWIDGRVTAGYQGAAVKNNQQLDEASSMARDLGELIVAELERNPLFISAVLPLKVYPPVFNRYGEGMQFGSHVDGVVRSIGRGGQKLRTDLSATVFLTPPESYDGGELVIESDLGSQQIKLTAGDVIVYPATSRHRVSRVTRGRRIAGVFWIQSLIRDDVQREQLFELDNTIQGLTRAGADSESLVRLTAHYHTLLRLWTEL
jgi:PKHD-type hydroxylase